jgi:hypothetical protein
MVVIVSMKMNEVCIIIAVFMRLGFQYRLQLLWKFSELLVFLLQRNLKIMINTGLSVKQEKDDRFQQIKKEVAEMITTRIPSVESNVC